MFTLKQQISKDDNGLDREVELKMVSLDTKDKLFIVHYILIKSLNGKVVVQTDMSEYFYYDENSVMYDVSAKQEAEKVSLQEESEEGNLEPIDVPTINVLEWVNSRLGDLPNVIKELILFEDALGTFNGK